MIRVPVFVVIVIDSGTLFSSKHLFGHTHQSRSKVNTREHYFCDPIGLIEKVRIRM